MQARPLSQCFVYIQCWMTYIVDLKNLVLLVFCHNPMVPNHCSGDHQCSLKMSWYGRPNPEDRINRKPDDPQKNDQKYQKLQDPKDEQYLFKPKSRFNFLLVNFDVIIEKVNKFTYYYVELLRYTFSVIFIGFSVKSNG